MESEQENRPTRTLEGTPFREHVLDSAEKLRAFFAELRGRVGEGRRIRCAVDAEADSMHAYETKLCLIQFGAGEDLALIDTLAIEPSEMAPFLDFLDDCGEVWMHGADYDMVLFLKAFGRMPREIWDTQTAARLVGYRRFGLANLLEQEFGIALSKQSQKADWGKRPLPEAMVRYAYDDVRYLGPLVDLLEKKLDDLGRRAWFEETCRAAQRDADGRDGPDTSERWRIQGWGKLSRQALCFLRELWVWRDEEARRMDRPPFKVLGNSYLIDFAGRLAEGERVEPPPFLRGGASRRMVQAIGGARKMTESEWPQKRLPRSGERLNINEGTFERLRSRRNREAARLDIEDTLIAPRWVLERLAAVNLDDEAKEDLLLPWQRELLIAEGDGGSSV